MAVLQSDAMSLPRPVRRRRRRRDAGDRPARRRPRPRRRTRGGATTPTSRRPRRPRTRPSRSTRLPDRHRAGDVDAALAAARGHGRRDVHHADATQQPDGAAHRPSRAGRSGRADALRFHAGRALRSGRRWRRCSGSKPERVRVISPYVGGGFGSKGCRTPTRARRAGGAGRAGPAGEARAHPAADVLRSPATGPRRSSASGSGPDADGRLTASRTTSSSRPRRSRSSPSRPRSPTRLMYAAPTPADHPPARRARRAGRPRGCARPASPPGMFAAEVGDGRAGRRPAGWTRSSCASATSPPVDPESGKPWSSRHLVAACGRALGGSAGRRATRGAAVRPRGGWRVGTGRGELDVPRVRQPGSAATDPCTTATGTIPC